MLLVGGVPGRYANSPAAPDTTLGGTMRRIHERGYLRAGVMFRTPGLGYRDPISGRLSGFEVELVKLIAQGMFGCSRSEVVELVQFVETASRDRSVKLVEDEVDLVASTYSASADSNKVRFTAPYMWSSRSVLTCDDGPAVEQFQDLNGLSVAISEGTTHAEALRETAPNARVHVFEDMVAAIDAVRVGTVDAYVGADVGVRGVALASGGMFRQTHVRTEAEQQFVAVQHGADDLAQFVEQRMQELMRSGDIGIAMRLMHAI